MERWFSTPKSTLSILIVCMVSAVVVLNATASADEIITGKQQFEIKLRDSFIRGIDTLDEALAIAKEVIQENKLFIES